MSHSTDLVGTVPHYINSRLWGLNCNSLYVVHSQQTRMSFQSAAKLAVAANRRPIRPRFGVFLFPSLRCCCFCCCFLIFKWMAPYEFRMQTAREENNTVASGLGTNGRKYRDLLTSDHNKIKRVYFAATDVLPSKQKSAGFIMNDMRLALNSHWPDFFSFCQMSELSVQLNHNNVLQMGT